jgi:hypothetical protein
MRTTLVTSPEAPPSSLLTQMKAISEAILSHSGFRDLQKTCSSLDRRQKTLGNWTNGLLRDVRPDPEASRFCREDQGGSGIPGKEALEDRIEWLRKLRSHARRLEEAILTSSSSSGGNASDISDPQSGYVFPAPPLIAL